MLTTNWTAKFEDNSIIPLYVYQVKVNDHGIAILMSYFMNGIILICGIP